MLPALAGHGRAYARKDRKGGSGVMSTTREQGCLLFTRNERDFLTDKPRARIPYILK